MLTAEGTQEKKTVGSHRKLSLRILDIYSNIRSNMPNLGKKNQVKLRNKLGIDVGFD